MEAVATSGRRRAMRARSRPRRIMVLVIIIVGALLPRAAAADPKDPIIVRLDTPSGNTGNIAEATHPQVTKAGFEVGAIPLFKKKVSASVGKTLKIELPYAATGYAWEYVAPKPGTVDQGAVLLTGPPKGKVQELRPAAEGSEQRERR